MRPGTTALSILQTKPEHRRMFELSVERKCRLNSGATRDPNGLFTCKYR